MPHYPVLTELPRPYLTGIGRVAAAWAVLEHEVKNAAYATLGVTQKQGRIAVRSPRAKELISMIRDLLSIDGIEVKTDLKELEKGIEKLQGGRDVLCHTIWTMGPDGEPILQDLSGSFSPDPKSPPVKRRISPTGMRIDIAHFREFSDLILRTSEVVVHLRNEILAKRKALREKSPGPSGRDHPPETQSPEMPTTPPESSRA